MKELCFFTNVSGEQYAAWTQAILSAVAIIASVLVVQRQHRLELKRMADAEADRKRQHIKSAFQLVGAMYQVTKKLVDWAKPGGTGQPDRYDLFKMRLELEGLVDALRQTDYGRFDSHTPIDATLVAMSVGRQMLEHVKNVYGLSAQLSSNDISDIGTMGGKLRQAAEGAPRQAPRDTVTDLRMRPMASAQVARGNHSKESHEQRDVHRRRYQAAAAGRPVKLAYACIGCATRRTPRAVQTRLIVSKRGALSGRKALYRASLVKPEALAISDIPRARAMSPSAAASNAASFDSRMTVR